ncbi:MAG: thiamine pyrophosphate-binding protein [Aquabacterium sp.]
MSAVLSFTSPRAELSAASLIVSYLEAIGVTHVFGVPGGAIEPLYNAMAVSMRRGGLRPVVARHEAGAAFMADGYARETGRIGVCCATSGPGATNLITGVACAYDNAVPMLVITGQPSLPVFGKGALQESACTGINTIGMFSHCTRYNTLVSHIDQLEHKLVQALMRASQAPHGPVHLSIPLDILRSTLPEPPRLTRNLPTLMRKPSLIDEDTVLSLAATMRTHPRMALIIGGDCGEAIHTIIQFAEMTQSPFVTTPDAKGLIHPQHPLYRGVFGFAGHRSSHAALHEDLDLILAIGTSLNEWTSGAWSQAVLNDKLVHIDATDDHLRHSPMARQHVRGRIRTVFEKLMQHLPEVDTLVAIPSTSKAAQATPHATPTHAPAQAGNSAISLREPEKMLSDATPIKPQRLMRELSQRFPETTRFVADAGNATAWAIHYLEARNNRQIGLIDTQAAPNVRERRRDHAGWLRVLMDFAPMGWAIGAAVGIARGRPTCPVVCITGDGSYLMNGQEITVAAQEGLNVVFVILNDGALGMVKHGQRLAGAERVAFELPTVDYAQLAQAMGIPGFVIRGPDDFDALDMDAMLHRGGPTLLDIRIDGEEVPPMDLRMQALEGRL